VDDSIVELHGGTKRVKTTSNAGIAERMTVGKYSVKNDLADLKTQLDTLIDAVLSLAGGTIPAGTGLAVPLSTASSAITTINGVKTQLALLLEAGA
jgi:hypothetical protein